MKLGCPAVTRRRPPLLPLAAPPGEARSRRHGPWQNQLTLSSLHVFQTHVTHTPMPDAQQAALLSLHMFAD